MSILSALFPFRCRPGLIPFQIIWRFIAITGLSITTVGLSAQTDFVLSDSLDKARQLIRSGDFQAGVLFLHQLTNDGSIAQADRAEIWHQIALHHYQAGTLDSSIHASTTALALRSPSKAGAVDMGRSLFLRAAAYREQSRLHAAAFDLDHAIKTLEAISEEEGAARRIPNLYVESARIQKLRGDYAVALLALQKARKLYLQRGELSTYRAANILQLEGTIFDETGQYQNAQQNYKDALDSLDQLTDVEELEGSIANNTGLLAFRQGNWAEAQTRFEQAIAAYRKCFDATAYPYYQQELANIYANLAALQQKQGYYATVLQTTEAGENLAIAGFGSSAHPVLAELSMHRANALAAQKENTRSLAAFDKAISILLPGLKTALNVAALDKQPILDRITLLEVLTEKAHALSRMDQFADAINTYKLADHLTDLLRQDYLLKGSKAALIRQVQRLYEGAISTCYEYCAEEENYCEQAYFFIAKNKAVLLLEDIQARIAQRFSHLPEEELLKEEQLQQEILKLEYQAGSIETPSDSLINPLAAAKSSYIAFLNKLKKQYPAYFSMKYALDAPLTTSQVQSALQPDELLLDYFIGEKDIYVAAISSTKYRIHALKKSANFDQQCISYRIMLDQQIATTDYVKLAFQLYNQILEPALPTDNTTQRLIIIPDGLLNLISFEGLLTRQQSEWLGRENAYLLNNYAVRYLYANHFLQDRLEKERARIRSIYAGFGLEYDEYTLQGLQEYAPQKVDTAWMKRAVGKLYYSDDEVKEVNALLGGKAWLNERATKAAFLENGARYRILHFAMHGLIDENQPLNSALAFSRPANETDFLLHAGDLYSIDLSAELAVLSACQTAYEANSFNSSGLKSMARAFTYAGCQSLVASLWNASDKSSKDIVSQFFKELKGGLPKDEALRQAKLRYMQEAPPAFTHPSFWANLIVIGDAKPIEIESYVASKWIIIFSIGTLLLLAAFWYLKKRA